MPQQYQLTQDDVAFMRRLATNSNAVPMPKLNELEKRVMANHVRFEDATTTEE